MIVSVLCVGWVNELVGGQHTGAKGFMFFGVNVDLTENGIGITSSAFCITHLLFSLSFFFPSQLLKRLRNFAKFFFSVCHGTINRHLLW